MRIYKRYEALSPIYQGGLTNHLPMIFVALKKLGFKEDEIVSKLERYKDQKTLLDLTEVTTPISEFEQAYINRTSFYLGDISQKGIDIVIGSFINQHKMNMGSALFHGLIRLAYAKKEQNELQIAQALAYFELTSEEIEFNSRYVNEVEFLSNFEEVVETHQNSEFRFDSSNTMSKFNELIELDLLKGKLFKVRNPRKEFILDFVVKNYLKTQCFYNLHLITGFEALLELEEYIYDFDDVMNQFLLYAQVFCLFNLEDAPKKEVKEQSFEELKSKVIELDDAHDIKLFYSLFELDKLFSLKAISTIANRIFE